MRNSWMRFHRFLGFFAFSAILFVTACSSSPESSSPDPDTDDAGKKEMKEISISAVPSTSSVILYVARDGGFFEEEGLDANIVEFQSGADAEKAMVVGAVDFGGSGVGSAMIAKAEGVPVKNLVLFQERQIFTLISRKDLEVPLGDLSALKGKKIGISSPGSLTDLLIRLALKDAGVDPDTDVTLIASGGIDGHLPALRTEQVDLQMTWEPATVIITKEEQAGDIFMDFRTDDIPDTLRQLVGSSLQATDEYLEENPDVAEAAVRAIVKASKAIQQDPSLMAKTLSTILPDISPDLLEEIANIEASSYNPVLDHDAITHMSEIYYEAGMTTSEVTYEEIVATQFSDLWTE